MADHSPSTRFYRARRRAMLAVLRRRRPIAAALAALTVWAVLSNLAPPPPHTVPLVVAARDLPAGAALEPADVVRMRVPPDAVPGEAATDPVGEVLAAPVTRGEPITRVRLLGADLAAGQPGMVAVPVRLPDPGMAALLHVGDVVDLIGTGGGPEPASSQSSGSAGGRVIAAGVRVLALPAPGNTGGATPGDLTSGRLIVIAVPTAQAAAVSGAAVRGYVTFVWTFH